MKFLFTFFLLFITLFTFTQNWQQVGDFSNPPYTFFEDTVSQQLYMGGSFRWVGQDTVNSICSWDGDTIRGLDHGLIGNCGDWDCVQANMITRYQNQIYVGAYMNEIGPVNAHGIAKWDGITWSQVGNDDLTLELGKPVVGDTYIKGDTLFAAGLFRTAGGDTCNSVAFWDGNQWTGMNFPYDYLFDGAPVLAAIEYYKGEWYVGGNCLNYIDGIENSDIARYNGSKWRQVGDGLKGGLSNVTDMVVYKDELYVSGYFRGIDGNVGNKIMRWNGEQWHDVGGGLCSPYNILMDMLVYKDKLIVVGIFDCVGDGLPVNNIAVWDGTHWCSFGNSIFDNKILSIGVYKDEIYVGGGFTKIDGQPVNYVARYVGDHSEDTCSAFVSVAIEPPGVGQLTISPNPTKDQILVSAASHIDVPTTWRIFNAAGQDVTALLHTLSAANAQQTVLDVQALPAGLYYLQAYGKAGLETGKFVKL